MTELPTRIRKARLLSGLSQAELARRVGVRRSAVTQWEHPAGTSPSTEHLIQIAIETGTRFEWLATGRGPPQCEDTTTDAAVHAAQAQDAHENQALQCFRRMPPARQRIALDILQALSV